ncbi:MAG TPA: hypothetical protein VGI33_14030 [Paenibacillus sp.]
MLAKLQLITAMIDRMFALQQLIKLINEIATKARKKINRPIQNQPTLDY